MDVTTDVQLIQTCVKAETAADCGTGCQWRHGTTAPTTPVTEKPPLFSEDFCHPVIVNKDTAAAVWDGCITSTTAATCSISAGCNWSTGKELIPDHDFCAPMDLTTDVALI
jgi:hypothetical protein